MNIIRTPETDTAKAKVTVDKHVEYFSTDRDAAKAVGLLILMAEAAKIEFTLKVHK